MNFASSRFRRVAVVHDWLTGMRGGEYVLEAILELFPQSEIFTLIHNPGSVSEAITRHPIHVSRLQGVPGVGEKYRHLLPLMPWAIEQFDLTGFDLVISSSHCVAKGIRRPEGAKHVSYVHAPMRYMWDRFDDYFGPGRMTGPVRMAAKLLRSRLQAWDRRVSQPKNVDVLIANSRFIAERIREFYGREAQVIYPFGDFSRFVRHKRRPENFYLMVGAFAPYKRVDLAIEVFNELRLPLKIVGSGQEGDRLRSLAGPTIEFLGSQSNDEIEKLYSACRAFVFPGKEDFGITPVEAMAAGAPVIAFNEGGASETVTPQTGILFHPQTHQALREAVQSLESGVTNVSTDLCRQRAREFSRERFQREFSQVISSL